MAQPLQRPIKAESDKQQDKLIENYKRVKGAGNSAGLHCQCHRKSATSFSHLSPEIRSIASARGSRYVSDRYNAGLEQPKVLEVYKLYVVVFTLTRVLGRSNVLPRCQKCDILGATITTGNFETSLIQNIAQSHLQPMGRY